MDEQVLSESREKLLDGDVAGIEQFCAYFFQKRTSGTRWTSEETIGHYRDQFSYDVLVAAWEASGRPNVLDLEAGGTRWGIEVKGRGNRVLFLLKHGYMFIPKFLRFVSPETDLALAITGTGSGKTSAVCLAVLACCVLLPGFRFLNVAPSKIQANLMINEAEGWIPGTKFDQFVNRTRGGEIFHTETGTAEIRSPFDEYVMSTFSCWTIGGSEGYNKVIGESTDWINFDECQLMSGLHSAVEALIMRMRGIRGDGEPRWNKMTLLTNPGDNPELEYLREILEKIRDRESGITVVIEEGVDALDNPYITEKQRRVHNAVLSAEGKRRWIHGLGDDGALTRIFPPVLVNKCRDKVMDVAIENGQDVTSREGMGIISYQMPYKPGHQYSVIGDPGQANATKISYNNVPVVLTFDIGLPGQFLAVPFKLVAFSMIDGMGTYKPWLAEMRAQMSFYGNAHGYYDATGKSTAFEDGDSLVGYDTTPVYLTLGEKNWAKVILVTLMQDAQIRWPYLATLWHQCRVYREHGQNVKSIPDDIIACLFVFCLSLKYDDEFWSAMEERYDLAMEREGHVQHDQILRKTAATLSREERRARISRRGTQGMRRIITRTYRSAGIRP